MTSGIIVARRDLPVIELAPMVARLDQTVEDMIAGMPNNNPDITSAHFPTAGAAGRARSLECRSGKTGQEEVRLCLAKPVHDREHLQTADVLRRLDQAGFVPEDLPQLCLLKDHAEELWAAGVYYVIALGPDSIWQKPDGGYAVYFILNPEDRGFHLHWLGGDLGGQLWFLVRRK
jgi:hypothetical protein